MASACGGSSHGAEPSGQGGGDASDVSDVFAPPDAADADSPRVEASVDAGPLQAGIDAAIATASGNASCVSIAPFYWEIGNSGGAVVGRSEGDGSVLSSTSMEVASASKLYFGAYVVERFKADLSAIDLGAMHMTNGYHSLTYASCLLSTTVQACFDAANNATHTPADDGFFFYNGGHFQKYAVDLGLGAKTRVELATEVSTLLDDELAVTYQSPQLAAGVRQTPADYARFLRKILDGRLAIGAHLGENAICTLPGASCPTAVSSPVPLAWHYSYGHWVEDDATGDGAFSSPGAFGFYPWMDASKRYYGLVARQSLAAMAAIESVQCGLQIRAAFMTGVAR
jgi:CubicO group peptidase (beta-lactamase class C family)